MERSGIAGRCSALFCRVHIVYFNPLTILAYRYCHLNYYARTNI